MSFKDTTFLWGLLLLLIPIFIHLFNFRRYKKVRFSNVAMLKEIQTESRKTRQIKKWLVLLTRMLALAALVFAFARPFIPNRGSEKGRSLISIYLDNSESMRAEGESGQLFENAKNTARTIINALPADAEIQIIDNALSPYSNRLFNKKNAEQIVDDMEVDFHVNALHSALERANSKFISDAFVNHHTFLLSDFQKKGDYTELSLDSSSHVYAFPSEPVSTQNLSIDSVWLDEPIVRPESPIRLRVKVTNNGDQAVESSSLILKINGVQQGVESFSLSEKSEKEFVLSFTSTLKGWIKGEISLNDFPVSFDNIYFFSLNVKPRLNVLNIGKSSPNLKRIFGTDQYFSYKHVSEGSVDYGSFSKYDLIILNEPKEIGTGLTEQLKQYVGQGGVLNVFPGSEAQNYANFASALGVSERKVLDSKRVSVSSSDLKKPFLREGYKRVPENIRLPKITKSWTYEKATRMEPILTLKDNSTLLQRKKIGQGSVFQWMVSMDKSQSNLAEHELFVLTMLRVAFSKSEKQKLAYSLFTPKPIEISEGTISDNAILLKNEENSIIVESGSGSGGVRIWLNDEVNSAGVYDVIDQENKLGSIALNYNRAESKQSYASEDELASLFSGVRYEKADSPDAGIKKATESLSQGTSLWKLFIILCLLFLLIEILLLRFLKA